MIHDLESVLREHRFLAGLSAEHVRFIVSCAKNLRFAKGQFLIREGEPADALHLIRHGRVALEIHVPGRGATQVETLLPGDVLGWSWLIEGQRWRLDAVAVEDTVAIALDGACLRNKMENDAALGFAISKLLLGRMQERLDRVRMQRLDMFGTDAYAELRTR